MRNPAPRCATSFSPLTPFCLTSTWSTGTFWCSLSLSLSLLLSLCSSQSISLECDVRINLLHWRILYPLQPCALSFSIHLSLSLSIFWRILVSPTCVVSLCRILSAVETHLLFACRLFHTSHYSQSTLACCVCVCVSICVCI
jgi:hypothetical protein